MLLLEKNINANGHGTFAIGQFNSTDPLADTENYSPLNYAFIIGNGVSENERSNAFSVLLTELQMLQGKLQHKNLMVMVLALLDFLLTLTRPALVVLNHQPTPL